ncbi:unnamed protein product [Meloidogyne enterolobii]|uniref:Uncharacterized protein n=1 Tax=Meloidogyne enterolobii TaxID=390850 RepID=A0ACB1ATX1_MELEN
MNISSNYQTEYSSNYNRETTNNSFNNERPSTIETTHSNKINNNETIFDSNSSNVINPQEIENPKSKLRSYKQNNPEKDLVPKSGVPEKGL